MFAAFFLAARDFSSEGRLRLRASPGGGKFLGRLFRVLGFVFMVLEPGKRTVLEIVLSMSSYGVQQPLRCLQP